MTGRTFRLKRGTLALAAGCLLAATAHAAAPQVYNPSDQGWFAVDPADVGRDSAPALLSLRSLNEPTAGVHGPVTIRDGQLLLGDGTPVRFFGTSTGKYLGKGVPANVKEDIDAQMAFMARNGMNLSRLRARPLFDQPDPIAPNAAKLDAYFYDVAAAKKQGIYTLLSVFFPLTNHLTADDQLAGMKAGAAPHAVLFFNPQYQAIYKQQLKVLLNTPNKYTGMTLAEDPALAVIELVNEDSMFFYTLNPNTVARPQWQMLEKAFGTWLAGRAGSLDKALAAFDKDKDDDVAAGRAGVLPAYALTQTFLAKAAPGVRRRAEAQAVFLTELQRGFYQQMEDYCRNELGAKCLFVASNWRTADATLTDALERYTYMPADILDTHRYYSSQKKGGANWLVTEGATFLQHCALLDPMGVPIQFTHYVGKANGVSEVDWSRPTYYRADYLPMAAAYGSLQGLAMLLPFSFEGPLSRAVPLNTNDASSPGGVASLPAAALMYRARYVAEAPPVVEQTVSLRDLLALKGTSATTQGQDANRDTGAGDHSSAADGYPPLAHYVGRVDRRFSPDASALKVADLSQYLDEKDRTIRSTTGQLTWNYGAGRMVINAPKVQGAMGFLRKAGAVNLPALTVDMRNDYGQVLLAALDDKPLAESHRMVLQVVTGERPRFWHAEPEADGRVKIVQLVKPGTKPAQAVNGTWMVQCPQGGVTLKRSGQVTVTPLTLDGHRAAREVTVSHAADGTRLTFDPETMLCLVEVQ